MFIESSSTPDLIYYQRSIDKALESYDLERSKEPHCSKLFEAGCYGPWERIFASGFW